MTTDDYRFMARAIELADRGRYTTQPNPRVGCVLVKEGRVVGEGYHQRAGQPHAERMAIADAGEQARGATAYVTLEPCCHYGKTPPCTEGLLEAGVSRVIAAMEDPNPLVAGKGLKQLEEAGVAVASGLMEADAKALNPGFVSRMIRGRPYVRCKLAMSLDGRTAMANGESQWITGPDARRDVQRLRARSDAIMTGIGTVVADNPSMNVRLTAEELGVTSGQPVTQPLRVVLDPTLDMSPVSEMLQLAGETLILCSPNAVGKKDLLSQAGAQIIQVEGDAQQLDLLQ
ncbi:MAG: bifunctional diaminohydroxyphosphoribosylaminopyrimidine deaminase/5-amino-6-(5-phosphoribosylamino)uracil reductase RibD, partial [Chromatiales bacterium]|nr:bifunctional diaminohydroxyphosphoribosylaminopyrimidine deaminase/5-amino-6-(5-phosphoribosylamino)uracil reductase RibD [Chromatiales bacterium]